MLRRRPARQDEGPGREAALARDGQVKPEGYRQVPRHNLHQGRCGGASLEDTRRDKRASAEEPENRAQRASRRLSTRPPFQRYTPFARAFAKTRSFSASRRSFASWRTRERHRKAPRFKRRFGRLVRAHGRRLHAACRYDGGGQGRPEAPLLVLNLYTKLKSHPNPENGRREGLPSLKLRQLP